MTPDEAREFFRSGDREDPTRSRDASKALKEEFARREGLRESRATGDAIAWLLGQPRPRELTWRRPKWFDHGTRWTKEGQPYCLVGQPYGLLPEAVRELAALIEHDIDVMIDVAPAWHYPGHVLSVRAFAPGYSPARPHGSVT